MNLARKLLEIDANKYKELKTGKVIAKNLSNVLGDAVEVEIKQLSDERLFELQCDMLNSNGDVDFSLGRDVYAIICSEGVTEPLLTDNELQKHYGATTPAELAKILFKGNDLQEIAEAISDLSEVNLDESTAKKK